MGLRKTTQGERMGTTVNVKVTLREKELLKAEAERRGVSISQMVLEPFKSLFAQEGGQ